MSVSLTVVPGFGSSDGIPAFLLWGVCFAISYRGFLLIGSALEK
jgi:hypothetical protein